MRISVGIAENEYQVGWVYLEEKELWGWEYLEVKGTLEKGLEFSKAEAPEPGPRPIGRYKINRHGWGRSFRLNHEYLVNQSPGRTKRPTLVPCTIVNDDCFQVGPYLFLPHQMKPFREYPATKKPAKEPEPSTALAVMELPRITPVQAYRTPDGKVFATTEEAQGHLTFLERLKKFEAFKGAHIAHFSVDPDDATAMMVMKDGRVVSFVATGKNATLSIASNGEML